MDARLKQVKDFWEEKSCGEALFLAGRKEADYRLQSQKRYELEPYIEETADFAGSRGKRVLEIGVGLGADHQRFCEAGANISGIDLTERAVGHVRDRFVAFGLSPRLLIADGQRLPYKADSVDIVYSWGVIHHAPSPSIILEEVHRVLKPAGTLRLMIYHKWSMVGLMLWLRYAFLSLRPWRSLTEIYSRYLESPGTKAYSKGQAHKLLQRFESVQIRTLLTHGDLLTSDAGQKHEGLLLRIARVLWPRKIIRILFPRLGLFMLITARKPAVAE
jgi:SAM-dependent methyltransferase